MNIADVTPRADYVLYVTADDGRAGLFDVKPFLQSEAFQPLLNRDEFVRVHNGRYFIEWACGADLSADTIEAQWCLVAQDNHRCGVG